MLFQFPPVAHGVGRGVGRSAPPWQKMMVCSQQERQTILMLNYSEVMALYEPYVALSYVCKLFEPCPFPN
jgi:hypothetical protein